MHLVAQRRVVARLRRLVLTVRFEQGEPLVTEHSYEFRLPDLGRELAAVGLDTTATVTDSCDWYALVLVHRRP
jgi:uncharacterized SAM-dependent methyltransferase